MHKVLLTALNEYGTEEIVGKNHNPEVLKYYKTVGQDWVKDDETAWCAAFVGHCLEVNKIQSTGSLSARSYLEWATETKDPKPGDIVILWRISKNSAYGHVGFFIKKTYSHVYILGGNQGNTVNISKFPLSQVLGYRML